MSVSDAEDAVTSGAYLLLALYVQSAMEQGTELRMKMILGTSSEPVLEAILPVSTRIAGTVELAICRLAHLDEW